MTNSIRAFSLPELTNLEIPKRELIFDPFLPTQGQMEIFAAAGIGKTTLALSLALAAATGSDFMSWKVSKPYKVLYLDGEMAASDMKERTVAAAKYFDTPPENIDNFKILSGDLNSGSLPDIGSFAGQLEYADEFAWADLIVLDNISCLWHSGRENDADAWTVVRSWLSELKSEGKSVILVHHAGKTGTSRGSSRRHDSLDTVMKLERPNSYSQSDGSVFEVHFEKSRGFAGDAAEPIGLQHSIVEGVSCWSKFSVSDEKLEQVANLVLEGMAQTDIASALNISQGEVSKRKKRAVSKGLL